MHRVTRRPGIALALAFGVLVLVLSVGRPAGVGAATFVDGSDVAVAAGEVVEGNLYIFGDTVRIEGEVEGDVISAGRRVEVADSGRIGGDLMAAGQEIIVQGQVTGDVRSAGYVIEAREGTAIGGELVAAGFSIALRENAGIGGDAMVAGAQGIFEGRLEGDLYFAGAALDIQGTVAGDVSAEVGDPADGDLEAQTFWTRFVPDAPEVPELSPMGLTLGDAATVGGDLSYSSTSEAKIPDGRVGGEVAFDLDQRPVAAAETDRGASESSSPVADWLQGALRRYLSLLIVGAVLIWLMPRALEFGRASLQENALPDAGLGLLAMIVAAAGLVVLFAGTLLALIFLGAITLGDLVGPVLAGSGLSFVLLTFGLSLLGWVGRVVVALWLGRMLLDRMSRAESSSVWTTLLVGIVPLAILHGVPVAGSLVTFLATILGLGAMLRYLWRILEVLRSDPLLVPQAGA